MLTGCQNNAIERMQRQVVKLAFGWANSYSTTCAQQGIKTLEERRKYNLDKFVAKSATNPRFADSWFPLRDLQGPNIRERRIFREMNARTSRYYNSPLAYMRRRANDLLDAA